MDHPSYLIKMISLMQIIVTTGAELLVCDGIFFIKKTSTKSMKFHFTEGKMMAVIKWKIRCCVLATITTRGNFSV